ncbi:hypothetical protein MFLO_12691 [Listeria floridensis FSL S10-1187]|uniref:ABC transmembrane type-2 domain-containing protein n=1 Tax=Listeria floridensis FSL S10-1187 TaxID=1265817 RepID=A0ABN0RCU8_9LIST|nr:ABC transporter permease [Listeria floridensis]EUJ28021.1 hypothetical protein MFLO_12691 [Listeria floridensis FSL S10-1187]
MRVLAIVKRIVNQFRHDKRTLALMFLAPILLITLLNYMFNSTSVEPKIGTYGFDASFSKALKDKELTVKKYGKNADPEAKIKEDKLDAFLRLDDGKLKVTYKNSDPSVSSQIAAKLQGALMEQQAAELKTAGASLKQAMKQLEAQTGTAFKAQAAMPNTGSKLKIEVSYLYGDQDTTYFDTIGPIFIGFFVFFFVFLIAGISFLRERTTGTLERLLVTPIKRYEIELGYMIGFGIFALLQSILVAIYSIHVLGMIQNGSIWYVFLITLTLAMVSLALGMLLSTFANNEFQIIQFIPIVIVPQILFCGIFPLEGMADWLQWLGHIMPMYYGAEALKAIMIRGEGFSGFAGDFYVLLGFVAVFLLLNIFALKKYRKI